MEDFQTIKAISSAIGLLIFMSVFIGACIWVFRPGSAEKYKRNAESILNEDSTNG